MMKNNSKNPTNSTPVANEIIFGNGLTIQEDLAKSILLQIEAMTLEMVTGLPYTLRKICGEKYWQHLNDGDRRRVGQYVNHLVTTGQLPLVKVDWGHEYPLKYMR